VPLQAVRLLCAVATLKSIHPSMRRAALAVHATFDGARTAIAHSKVARPMRLLPRRSPAIDKLGTQHLEMGPLRGGSLDLSVRSSPGATLCLTSRSTRIVQPATLNLNIDVGEESLLCLAPGPRELCGEGDLEQTYRLRLTPHSSLVCIDWARFPPPHELGGPDLLGWAARLGGYHSTSEVVQRDGVTARDTFSYEMGGAKWAALSFDLGAACSDAVSIIVSGSRASGVAEALRTSGVAVHKASAGMLGAARLHVREVAAEGDDSQPVLIARLTTELSEDAYRLLALCLLPLQSELGHLPYADRLRAAATQRPPRQEPIQQPSLRMPPVAPDPPPFAPPPSWAPPHFGKVPHFAPPSFAPPPSFRMPEPCC